MEAVTLICGDCLDELPKLPSASADMILCDLPYGITACKWDEIINLERLWGEYTRIIKPNSAIVLFGSQPFTGALVMSNPKLFKYEWIYQKIAGSNLAAAKYMPIKEHENILVFGKGTVKYYPQMQERSEGGKKRLNTPYHTNSATLNETMANIPRTVAGKTYDKELRYPGSVQKFNNRAAGDRGLHPTQKPQALCEYLIQTYTEPGAVVLDNCMGSGTTGAAARKLGRRFIGIEKDPKYFETARARLGKEGE